MKQINVKSFKETLIESGLLDSLFIMNVITDYNDGNFIEMKRQIDEYGKHRFFQDLYTLFENQTSWRSRTNQYLNFVGITIQYMKYMNCDVEESGRQAIKTKVNH
jgi:hypothetical protein